MEQYNEILKLKTMTKKRFIKLLMGRFRFSRNEAREITACVQWNKRCSDDTNRSAKYNLSGYREIPESYQRNWRRIRWTCTKNEKYGGFDYCPSCHTVRPFVVAHHPREMTVRGISFTWVETLPKCMYCFCESHYAKTAEANARAMETAYMEAYLKSKEKHYGRG